MTDNQSGSGVECVALNLLLKFIKPPGLVCLSHRDNLNLEPWLLQDEIVFAGPSLSGFPDLGDEQVLEVAVLHRTRDVLVTGHCHRQSFPCSILLLIESLTIR